MKDLKKLLAIWNAQCISTKIILLIGFACLLNLALSTFLITANNIENNMVIKSILSSVVGYIFGKHCMTSNFGNEGIQTLTAGLIAFVCLVVLFVSSWTSLSPSLTSLREIRDLLLIVVGFLISKSKEDKTCS